MALGFSSALRRALSAIQASCSFVVPYLSKCACAYIAIHTAADGAENGNVHSMKPLTLNPPPPPPPGITAERPCSPCALPSHTVRKQTTWLHRPAPTASTAFMTDPSCPD